jgi:hypothetical protein
MRYHVRLVVSACMIVIAASCTSLRTRGKIAPAPQDIAAEIQRSIGQYVQEHVSKDCEGPLPRRTKLDRVELHDSVVRLYFGEALVHQPVRQALVDDLRSRFTPLVEPTLKGARMEIYARGRRLEDFIPGLYRPPGMLPEKLSPSPKPLLKRDASAPEPAPTAGLYNHYIALWHSHGCYYDTLEKRWQWQRPRMFTTVEDMLPMSFTIPFLMPMLENAGAIVFCARERDLQIHEVVVDDDDGKLHPDNGTFEEEGSAPWQPDDGYGFKNWLAPYPDDVNPHRQGHHRVAPTVRGEATATARWTPVIPESGYYGIYLSYNASPERASDAHYVVHHTGGKTEFRVNQQMAGNTWLYLGRFYFRKGCFPEWGSVALLNDSANAGTSVSADAVKFGGGMGNVLREGTTSGYPRYCEGARYWLQYAGVQPELVYKLGIESKFGGPDYLEDYTGRGEWVNYLHGAPSGPNAKREYPGLGIPLDLSFGFHTDAGITSGVIGTLMIYRVEDEKKSQVFPDGRSRWLNRDFADLVQSQIIHDLRLKYSSSWTRRELWDADYAEVRRPNVPALLVELLSHQNFDDIKYALDPRFRFDVARAIYKGMLRFIAYEYGFEPVVTPLAPRLLVAKATGSGKVLIQWEPQDDPLEPTAVATGYLVYRRIGENAGFDNGTYVGQNHIELEGLSPGIIYSFKVVAVNAGGKSMPSEVLCIRAGKAEKERRALIVNGFDRVAAPTFVESAGVRGAMRANADRGVGYGWNLGLTGDQYDFNSRHNFLTNDNPGWGASYGNLETNLELGNTFDFAIVHGRALADAGWDFDSASDEAVAAGKVNLKEYALVDWLLGEERTASPPPWVEGPGVPDKMVPQFKVLSPEEQSVISDYLTEAGGRLFISGAYVATDLGGTEPTVTKSDREFLRSILKCEWVTNNGSKTNDVVAVGGGMLAGVGEFHFSQGAGEDGTYGVELPDSLKPAKDSGAFSVIRYKDGGFSAGIAYAGANYRIVVFGFPFETITNGEIRSRVMGGVAEFLTAK